MGLTKDGLTNGGFTSRYDFSYDEALAGLEPGRLNQVIAACDDDLAMMAGWFGYQVHNHDTVTVIANPDAPGLGAHTHITDTAFAPEDITINLYDVGNAVLVRYLLIAEMSEVYMRGADPALPPRQWFGPSNEGSEGEALSHFLSARFLAAGNLGQVPDNYTISKLWLTSARSDYVNNPAVDDNNPDEVTGCGLLFLYYLYSQLGHGINQIIWAGAPTLAQCYRNLTGASDDPFPAFKALIDNYFPGTATIAQGDPDNPFPLAWPRQLFDGDGMVYVAPGNDGALYAFARPASGYWYGPTAITPPGQVTAGSTVALGPQGSSQLDAVYVGSDGALNAVWAVDGVAGWQGPHPISPAGVADPGATVSLAAQGSSQLDAVFVGSDGSLNAVWAVEGVAGWQGPHAISPPGLIDPGGTVALCGQGPNQLDAVFVGLDGALHVAWAVEGVAGWQGPQPISPPGLVDPGTGVSLVAGGLHQVDAVYVGLDGAVHTVWVSEGVDGWQGPAAISQAGVADPSAPVSIAAHGLHTLDVTYVGLDSAVYTMWADPGDPAWQGPLALTPAGTVDPGAAVRLVAGRLGRVDAAFVGLDGAVYAVGAGPAASGALDPWERAVARSGGGLFSGTATSGARFATVSHGTARVDVVGRGRDSAFYHRSFDGTAWSGGWDSLGGVFTGSPAAVAAGPAAVHVFGRGRDSAFYHRSFDGTAWSPAWDSLGGVFTGPPAVVAAAGTVHVFGRGTDSAYYHCSLDASTGQVLTGWVTLGGQFTSPPAVAAYRGINIVGRGTDGSYYRRTFDGAAWSPAAGWEPLGGVFTSPPAQAATPPSLLAVGHGTLEVIGRGRDSGYYRRSFDGAAWSPAAGWEPLGGVFTSPPAVLSTGPGDLEVFGRGRDSALYHRSSTGPTWNPPSGWEDLGGVFSDQ